MGDNQDQERKKFKKDNGEHSGAASNYVVLSSSDDNISEDDSKLISSDNDSDVEIVVTSDDDSMTELKNKEARDECISKLFPTTSQSVEKAESVTTKKTVVNKMIEGVNVAFPMEPYGCQVALMSKIIMAIKREENCILESPTGTGKTLALLCGALAWQQKTKEIAEQKLAGMKSAMEDIENLSEFIGSIPFVPTIYYGARTHAQLKQVIAEFKRTPYCGGMNGAKMTILSSREQACVREYDNAQWTSKNDMCQKCIKPVVGVLGPSRSNCNYFDNREELTQLFSDRNGFDLEELKAEGREKVSCPYYAARSLSKKANIIFCPYNYLIDPNIKERLEIRLQKNIVIIDEAHNIENICRDAQTYVIEWAQIEKSYEELEKGSKYYDKLLHLEKVMFNWKTWFNNHSKLVKNEEFLKSWETKGLVESLDNHNIGRDQLNDFMAHAADVDQMYQNSPERLFGITETTVTLLGTLAMALRAIFQHDTEYKPKLVQENGFLKSLKLDCLNPALAMKHMTGARCIALASGTLSPLESLYSELGTDFKHKVSLNHVIKRDRVWIGNLSRDGKGQRIQCTADKMADEGIARTLGQVIVNVCEVTPNGVLCVLPSYGVMDKLVQRWECDGIMNELHRLKFVHKESTKNHEALMRQYFEDVETSRGALLFAVHRGKVSEGIDLKDNQARCVICIGIPYPYLGEAEAKREYNKKYCKERNLLNGNQWYDIQAFRTLNQAVGRCVRHANDWGAVLLVDCRFDDQKYRAKLAGWVRNYMDPESFDPNSLFSDEPRSLKSFMERLTTNQEKN